MEHRACRSKMALLSRPWDINCWRDFEAAKADNGIGSFDLRFQALWVMLVDGMYFTG